MQCFAAFRATCRKQQTPQLWSEGKRRSVDCFVLWSYPIWVQCLNNFVADYVSMQVDIGLFQKELHLLPFDGKIFLALLLKRPPKCCLSGWTFFIFSFNWAKAENTIISFKLRFGWCFMWTWLCIMFCLLHELHMQCMQIHKKLMHCMCKLCKESNIHVLHKVGFHEAPPKWEFKEYYGFFLRDFVCWSQESVTKYYVNREKKI